MTLEETLKQIKPLNEEKMKTARRRWDSIAKPLHSLGKMEDLITQIVGITGEEKVDLGKKALVAMCADNGVVEEGVTQTGQEVTAIVADNFCLLYTSSEVPRQVNKASGVDALRGNTRSHPEHDG